MILTNTSLLSTGSSTIVEIINPNIGYNPVALLQPAVAPVGDMPLQGIHFLLDIIGFHIPVECERLIKASLVNYEDFHYLIEKDIWDMVEEFSK